MDLHESSSDGEDPDPDAIMDSLEALEAVQEAERVVLEERPPKEDIDPDEEEINLLLRNMDIYDDFVPLLFLKACDPSVKDVMFVGSSLAISPNVENLMRNHFNGFVKGPSNVSDSVHFVNLLLSCGFTVSRTSNENAITFSHIHFKRDSEIDYKKIKVNYNKLRLIQAIQEGKNADDEFKGLKKEVEFINLDLGLEHLSEELSISLALATGHVENFEKTSNSVNKVFRNYMP